MGKLMLGLAMAAVVLRSYIGLSPWKLALLLLSLFVLNLLQVRVRVVRCGEGMCRPALVSSAPQLRLGTLHSAPCSTVDTYSHCGPNPNVLQGAPSESEAFSPIYHGDDASGLKWGVASVQGRRPHMEDMYQAEGFGGPAASGPHSAGQAADAARLGLTHFFAVFDGAHAPSPQP